MSTTIADFMAITGCESEEEARRLLDMYENDLDRAVETYMDQENRSDQSPASDVEVVEEEDEEDMDEEEEYSDVEPDDFDFFDEFEDDDEERIRQSIRPVTGQLVDDSLLQAWREGLPPNDIFQSAADFHALARRQQQMLNGNRGNPAGRQGAGAEARPAAAALETLFLPPVKLLFAGPFQAARKFGTQKNRWLLANLQKNSEFACACLNRDIWKNETVQEVVKKNFIFWQVAENSPELKRIACYYNVTSFPTVLIIDPRTGEAVTNVNRLKDAVPFLEALTEFLERFPDFASYDQSFVPSHKKNKSNSENVVLEEAAASDKKKAPKRKSDEKNDESGASSKQSRVTSSSSKNPEGNKAAMGEIDELCNHGTKLTTVDREEWRNLVGPEMPGAKNIQIAIRLPNSQREKFEVPATTQLRAVFIFLEGRGVNSREHVLVLTYPRREYSLDTHSSQTLHQLGFNHQELIHVDRKQ